MVHGTGFDHSVGCKINALNSVSESWTGMGVVAGFAAVVVIVEGPHVSTGYATHRIKLL
jgi:hypothetical protein